MTTRCKKLRFVVLDLDGTLIRGNNCCELIAARIGRLKRMREFFGKDFPDRPGASRRLSAYAASIATRSRWRGAVRLSATARCCVQRLSHIATEPARHRNRQLKSGF